MKDTIALVITHLARGGAQRVVLTLAERLDRDRFEVVLFTGPGGDWQERAVAIEGLEVRLVPELVREVSPRKDLAAFSKLFLEFRRLQRRSEGRLLVHTHAPKPGLLARQAARMAGVKVLHTLHGLPFDARQPLLKRTAYRLFERAGYRYREPVVSVCRTNADLLADSSWCHPDVLRVIYPCTEVEKFRPLEGKRSVLQHFGIGEDDPVVGMVASLKPPKDPLTFVKAAERLHGSHPEVHFVLAGGGPLMPDVRAEVEKRGLSSRFHLPGWIAGPERLIPELDLFVLASSNEGLPLVLAEAMASGVVAVSSRVAGVPEVIRDGETGFLFAPGDDAELAGIMEEILFDAERCKAISTQAFSMVDRFRPETMVREHERLYEELLHS